MATTQDMNGGSGMLNLTKLYEVQETFRKRIKYKGKDKEQKILILLTALRTEIGEMMNEWRGFKVWSKNRLPNRDNPTKCVRCDGRGMLTQNWGFDRRKCDYCDGSGVFFENPLLEEYVDGLHFILDLGLDLNCQVGVAFAYVPSIEDWGVMDQVESIHDTITDLRKHQDNEEIYRQLINLYLGLGELLQYSEVEIKDAYLAKNEENHNRQERGY